MHNYFYSGFVASATGDAGGTFYDGVVRLNFRVAGQSDYERAVSCIKDKCSLSPGDSLRLTAFNLLGSS